MKDTGKNKTSVWKRQKDEADIMSMGKVPPHSKELEQVVLGICLIEPSSVEIVLPILKVEDFYFEKHQWIFNSIVSLFTKNQKVDILTVIEELKLGGNEVPAYEITVLTKHVISNAHLVDWCRYIKSFSQKRKLAKAATKYLHLCFDDTTEVSELLSKSQLEINKIEQEVSTHKTSHISDVAFHTIDEMKKASLNDNPYLGCKTGFKKLDQITLGFSAPDFIVIGASGGEGKSTFALQVARNIGYAGEPTALFSLEMKNQQLMWKIFSSQIDEDVKTIRKGKIEEHKWKMLADTYTEMKKVPIFMHEIGGLSVLELMSIVRSLKAKYNIKIVIIDYLQLLNGYGSDRKFGTREEEVNFISKRLKELAMELNICIIALSQMNRLEKGSKRMYRKSDLRESGALEQDSDGIIFIWRPKVHEITSIKFNGVDTNFDDNDAIFIIDKWRLGETGSIRMKFNGKFNRFEEMEEPVTSIRGFKPVAQANIEQLNKIQMPLSSETDDLPF